MPHDKLIRMANQIAGFFATQPGADQAERVAAHLRDFWAPEMRQDLKESAKAQDAGLAPLLRAALAHL